jgi:hypothetical protein
VISLRDVACTSGEIAVIAKFCPVKRASIRSATFVLKPSFAPSDSISLQVADSSIKA